MIPAQNIVAWGNLVPWTDARQVEQDLIISRALVEIFSDPMLRETLRFRGGTALNKLHFPVPLRYSEDIDFVRTAHGPIGPVLDQLRVVLEPWLGRAQFEQSPVAPKFRFRVEAEDGSGVPIRLKIEINRGLRGSGYRPHRRDVRAVPGPFGSDHLAGAGPGAHVRKVGQSALLARCAPVTARRPGRNSDGGVDSGGVSPGVRDPCRSASRRALGKDGGDEAKVRRICVSATRPSTGISSSTSI